MPCSKCLFFFFSQTIKLSSTSDRVVITHMKFEYGMSRRHAGLMCPQCASGNLGESSANGSRAGGRRHDLRAVDHLQRDKQLMLNCSCIPAHVGISPHNFLIYSKHPAYEISATVSVMSLPSLVFKRDDGLFGKYSICSIKLNNMRVY